MILSRTDVELPIFGVTNLDRAYNKMDDQRVLISAKSFHIFGATESWLSDMHSDDFFSIDGFDLFREDRSDGRIGGGVILWAKSSLRPIKYQPKGYHFGSDSVWILMHASKICFICIYIPPSSVIKFSTSVISFLAQNIDDILIAYPQYEIIITGDFNRTNIGYLSTSFDLKNIVTEPTRGNAILDIVLLGSSFSDKYEVDVGPPVANSDHKTVLCSPKTADSSPQNRICTIHDLRKSNVANLSTS